MSGNNKIKTSFWKKTINFVKKFTFSVGGIVTGAFIGLIIPIPGTALIGAIVGGIIGRLIEGVCEKADSALPSNKTTHDTQNQPPNIPKKASNSDTTSSHDSSTYEIDHILHDGHVVEAQAQAIAPLTPPPTPPSSTHHLSPPLRSAEPQVKYIHPEEDEEGGEGEGRRKKLQKTYRSF